MFGDPSAKNIELVLKRLNDKNKPKYAENDITIAIMSTDDTLLSSTKAKADAVISFLESNCNPIGQIDTSTKVTNTSTNTGNTAITNNNAVDTNDLMKLSAEDDTTDEMKVDMPTLAASALEHFPTSKKARTDIGNPNNNAQSDESINKIGSSGSNTKGVSEECDTKVESSDTKMGSSHLPSTNLILEAIKFSNTNKVQDKGVDDIIKLVQTHQKKGGLDANEYKDFSGSLGDLVGIPGMSYGNYVNMSINMFENIGDNNDDSLLQVDDNMDEDLGGDVDEEEEVTVGYHGSMASALPGNHHAALKAKAMAPAGEEIDRLIDQVDDINLNGNGDVEMSGGDKAETAYRSVFAMLSQQNIKKKNKNMAALHDEIEQIIHKEYAEGNGDDKRANEINGHVKDLLRVLAMDNSATAIESNEFGRLDRDLKQCLTVFWDGKDYDSEEENEMFDDDVDDDEESDDRELVEQNDLDLSINDDDSSSS